MADNINTQRPYKGLFLDCAVIDQPKETYRYALNAVTSTREGTDNFLSTESSTESILSNTNDFQILGKISMQNDSIAVLGFYNGAEVIGILDNNQELTTAVHSAAFGFDEKYPIRGTYRLRRNNERVIYWVDDKSKPRHFNFDRPYDFYTVEYQQWLEGTRAFPFVGIQWDTNKFDLIRGYEYIPEFTKVEIIEGGGAIASGSYNAAIQLVDANLNATEFITVSNTVNVYVDPISLEYSQIRGSRNSNSQAQDFSKANKSIKWTIANLDPSFLYYRIAILQANMNDGNVAQALVSPLISISNGSFTYTGNDGDFTIIPASDVQVTKMDISSAAYIEQLENRLILAGIKGKQVDYCSFQKYASKITSKLVTTYVPVSDAEAKGNPKNPIRNLTGYMPGEAYSEGIVYIFNDGTESPAFHISGRPQGATPVEEAALLLSTGMEYYECSDNLYIPLHTCMEEEYWGVDGYGNTLVGTPIRHHRFPFRSSEMLKEDTVTIETGRGVQAKAIINFQEYQFLVGETYRGILNYDVNGATYGKAIGPCLTPATTAVMTGAEWIALGGTASVTLGIYPEGSSIGNFVLEWIEGSGASTPVDPELITVTNNTDYNYPITETKTLLVNEVFGLQFENIERPHPDVIGYRIVRNKRTEEDKLIIDNVLLGPLMNSDITTPAPATNDYHSFGLICPDLDAGGKFSTKGLSIFSPEHQFYNKKINFSKIIINGIYTRSAKYLPTSGTYNGVNLEDVKAGTTFDARYEKGTDPDGFSLQVFYRVNDFTYSIAALPVLHTDKDEPLNPIKDTYYLSATGNKSDDAGNIFFNAGVDNKIIVTTFDSDIDAEALFGTATPNLLLASLKQENTTAYNNFINRTYYREHENPMYFTTEIVSSEEIYNGDAYVAPMTINSSTYFDTKFSDAEKKSKTWKIVLGAVLVLAAIAVNIIPGIGQVVSATLITAITTMAVGYGVSMITSGIEFNAMKKMMDIDYEAGLKITLQDEDNKDANYDAVDDRFCWFVDRAQNIYFESSVNIGLRSGLTAPLSDFINSPSETVAAYIGTANTASREQFEAYIIGKFTVLDREQNDGRLYIGYANAEFYDINLDYLRKIYEKSHYYLPIEYECCSITIETFNNRVHYSEQSYQEEKIDNFRTFLPNNYRDIEGETGRITNIFKVGESLFIHTEEGIYQLPRNLQERVTQELVSFIGTGEFFAIPPKRFQGSGSNHPEATVKTPYGVVYVSTHNKMIGIISEQGINISNNGISAWCKENLVMELENYIKRTLSGEYSLSQNTQARFGTGIHAGYDNRFERLLITKNDYYPAQDCILFTQQPAIDGAFVYDSVLQQFGIGAWDEIQEIGTYTVVDFTDKNYFIDKSWTLSFSFKTKSWVSFHSYLPYVYLHTDNYLYSINSKSRKNIWMHNKIGSFLKFYGAYCSYIIDYVSLSNPITERIWNDLTLQVEAQKYLSDYKDYVAVRNVFFTNIILYNSRQCSGLLNIVLEETLAGDYSTYMTEQIKDVASRIIAKHSLGKWNLNQFEDLIVDLDVPMFLKDWESIQNDYPIDKLINPDAISTGKEWQELERFRDKYLCVRLIFDNFAGNENVQLTTNYSFESEQISM